MLQSSMYCVCLYIYIFCIHTYMVDTIVRIAWTVLKVNENTEKNISNMYCAY